MTRPFQLVAAGIAMVGTAFGLARYGYGLLLPEIRRDFGLSSAALGLIATGSYVAYLLTTAAMAAFGDRAPPRRPVVLGGVAAVAGMVLIAVAHSPWLLAAGVIVAGVSAALAYPPFSTAVAGSLPPERRGRALAMISSGTGWGVAIAVPIALVAGAAWRGAWVAFAVIAGLSTLLAARALRPDRLQRAAGPGGAQALPPLSWSWFVCPRSGPLLAGALLVGVGASVYWTFAADFASSGSGHSAAGPVLLGVVGVSSLLGSGAGDVLERVGGRRALVVSAGALAASMCVLALWNGSWVAIVLSAAAFGSTYNVLLAVQAIWSARVFAQRPATGLAAMLFMLAIGQVAGPALAGVLADRAGLAAAFLAGGAVIGLAALLPPREELRASAPVAEPRRVSG
jgi:predicted MFS family arabinose efflux permease